MSTVYYKVAEDLSRQELCRIYDSLPDKVYPCKIPISDKSSIVLNILDLDNAFFAPGRKFVFKSQPGVVEFQKDNDGSNVELQKFAKPHHKLNIAQIQASSTADSLQALISSMKVESDLSEPESSDGSLSEDSLEEFSTIS